MREDDQQAWHHQQQLEQEYEQNRTGTASRAISAASDFEAAEAVGEAGGNGQASEGKLQRLRWLSPD